MLLLEFTFEWELKDEEEFPEGEVLEAPTPFEPVPSGSFRPFILEPQPDGIPPP